MFCSKSEWAITIQFNSVLHVACAFHTTNSKWRNATQKKKKKKPGCITDCTVRKFCWCRSMSRLGLKRNVCFKSRVNPTKIKQCPTWLRNSVWNLYYKINENVCIGHENEIFFLPMHYGAIIMEEKKRFLWKPTRLYILVTLPTTQ